MIHDVAELGRVGGVLSETLELLEAEQKRFEQQYGQARYVEGSAGPRQALHGIGELCPGIKGTLQHIAVAAVFISLGLGGQATR